MSKIAKLNEKLFAEAVSMQRDANTFGSRSMVGSLAAGHAAGLVRAIIAATEIETGHTVSSTALLEAVKYAAENPQVDTVWETEPETTT